MCNSNCPFACCGQGSLSTISHVQIIRATHMDSVFVKSNTKLSMDEWMDENLRSLSPETQRWVLNRAAARLFACIFAAGRPSGARRAGGAIAGRPSGGRRCRCSHWRGGIAQSEAQERRPHPGIEEARFPEQDLQHLLPMLHQCVVPNPFFSSCAE